MNEAKLRIAISTALVQARRRIGISQQSLSFKADVSGCYVNRIEGCKANASLRLLWRLAESLEMKPSHFFQEIERIYNNLP